MQPVCNYMYKCQIEPTNFMIIWQTIHFVDENFKLYVWVDLKKMKLTY